MILNIEEENIKIWNLHTPANPTKYGYYTEKLVFLEILYGLNNSELCNQKIIFTKQFYFFL